ncbi:MAG: hypothetical protein Q9182_006524 [Xanthomendoza sp. 2 TL-2023]
MAGTYIITGANGSLAIPAIKYLLTKYPNSTLIATVRNADETDLNTRSLRNTLNAFPQANTFIRQLDLTLLSSVHDFAKSIAADISSGKLPPLSAIICNAYYWNLVKPIEITEDGYEKCFQVSHLSHVALVLRLLGSFGLSGGRIVLLSSDAHKPGANGLAKYLPAIPDDLEQLVKPAADVPVDNFGKGFLRYGNSKLDPSLSKITAVAINPGNLPDSRALRTNSPNWLFYLSKFVFGPLLFLLRRIDPIMRTSAEAGADVIALATNEAFPGERGFFTWLKKDESSVESLDEEKQRKLWVKSAEWVGIGADDTKLKTLDL